MTEVGLFLARAGFEDSVLYRPITQNIATILDIDEISGGTVGLFNISLITDLKEIIYILAAIVFWLFIDIF